MHVRLLLYNRHWLPIKFQIDFKILLLTYKAINIGLAPFYLQELIRLKEACKYKLRSDCDGLLLQYRPRALQHLHVRKLRAIGQISTKNPCKKLVCKFLHKPLHADFLHAYSSVLLRWLILLTKIHASCVYFFTTENLADVKLETDIVEKMSFRGERENNLLSVHFLFYDHATIANVMFYNQRFPWLLAELLFDM